MSDLQERINEIRKEILIVMDRTKVLRSHPFHNAESGDATSATFHERFTIKNDMDFKWMNKQECLMAHGLLHFLYHRIKMGKKVEEGLTKDNIKILHEKLKKGRRIPHHNFDDLDY